MRLDRILKKTSGTYALACATEDDAGNTLTVTSPGLTVVDGAGTQVFTGTPTVGSGRLTASIPVANLPRLDTYTATWTGTAAGQPVEWTTAIELAGGYLFSLAALRARDPEFADDDRWPDADLEQARIVAEDALEGPQAACVAFVPRGRRVALDGSGRSALRAPDFEIREVYAVTVDGVAWTSPQVAAIAIDDCRLVLPSGQTWPAGVRNVALHYAHGRDRPATPIARAALTLAREYLADATGGVPARATATTIGDQTFRLTIAGRDGVTGIPDVDAAIDQHGRKRLGYA